MRILKLPASDPEKFGSRRVRKADGKRADGSNQLDLFSAGRMLKLHPLSAFEEALLMDERGETGTARKLYKKAIEQGDQPANACCNLGILESQEGRTAEAVNYLTLSLKHDARHPEAHFNLANLYVDAGNLELGILHYEITIEIDPAFPNSYFNLGLALAAAGEYGRAAEVLGEYCKLAPAQEQPAARDLIKKLRTMG